MYEQWIIALLVAPLVIAFESFALRGTKIGQFVPHSILPG